MASIRKPITTRASPALVWSVIRDIGALHAGLVSGFVVDTRLELGGADRNVCQRHYRPRNHRHDRR